MCWILCVTVWCILLSISLTLTWTTDTDIDFSLPLAEAVTVSPSGVRLGIPFLLIIVIYLISGTYVPLPFLAQHELWRIRAQDLPV